MTLGQPRPPGQVERSPGSVLAILLGLAVAIGLALFALARKPAPPQPVQVLPASPNAAAPSDNPPLDASTPPAAPAFPETPAPPPVAELVGEQSTDQPVLTPVVPPPAEQKKSAKLAGEDAAPPTPSPPPASK